MTQNWFPGHMKKAQNEILENIKKTDFIIVVLDARAPYSSFNKELAARFIDKPTIFVMNKMDLCDEEITYKFVVRAGAIPKIENSMYFMFKGQRYDINYFNPNYKYRDTVEIICKLVIE